MTNINNVSQQPASTVTTAKQDLARLDKEAEPEQTNPPGASACVTSQEAWVALKRISMSSSMMGRDGKPASKPDNQSGLVRLGEVFKMPLCDK